MSLGPTHVAFLRAVNVGGRTATKERLIAAALAAGASHVSTFLASGNVLFAPGELPARRATLESALETAFESELGFRSEAFVRSADQLVALVEGDPWDGAVDLASGTYNVGFLRTALSDPARQEFLALSTDVDHLAAIGTELHWHTAAKMSDSTLFDRPMLDRSTPVTLRNIRTVRRLLAKLDD